MLQQVASQGSGMTSARAVYLEGEYFYRKSDLLEAAKRFVAAAEAGASDAGLFRVRPLPGRGDDEARPAPDQVQVICEKDVGQLPIVALDSQGAQAAGGREMSKLRFLSLSWSSWRLLPWGLQTSRPSPPSPSSCCRR